MKKVIFLAAFSLFIACKDNEQRKNVEAAKSEAEKVVYNSFGKEISAERALDISAMAAEYDKMKTGDTLPLKFKGKVKEVCIKKGCWMKLDLENGQEAMVKFKDYGFFVPKDIVGSEVIVNGAAYIEEMSVEDQKHYAEDGGESESEIAKIETPKKTNLFMADGVLIKTK